jgi:hypothetical protein
VAIAANVGVTSQPRLTPYITVDMFVRHRRRGVQVDNLVKGARPDEQHAAVAEAIESACAWIDNTILYTLAATVDTVEDDRITPNRYGILNIRPRYRPVVALLDFWCGPRPDRLSQAGDLSVAGVLPDKISMPVGGALSLVSSQGPLQLGSYSAGEDPMWVRYSYINGFPVTSLAAPVAAGDRAVSVDDCTGIIAGQTWLTVYGLQNRFRFLAGAVSAQFGPGTVACPAAPHAVPVTGYQPPMVSALPPDVIEAAVLATRAVIKDSPGADKPATGRGTTSKDEASTSGDDFAEAEGFLHPYIYPVE